MLREKIFKLFGPYEKSNDANKDVAGKGTLERYIESYGDDLDTNILPLIDDMTPNLFHPDNLFTRFLDYHEETRGVLPLNFLRNDTDTNTQALNERMRRRVLRIIEKLQNIKGTKLCYTVLIRLIDATVTTITYQEYFIESRYDVHLYDDDNRYDSSICSECPQYSIDIATADTLALPTVDIIKAIKSIIAFNHPIDCKIKYIKYNSTTINLS